MNAARSTNSSRESRRFRKRSPVFEFLEDRRLLSLTWNSTSLSFFFHDNNGAKVTPKGEFFATETFSIERSKDQGATWRTSFLLPRLPEEPSPTLPQTLPR